MIKLTKLTLVLAGIGWMARTGRVRLAAGALVLLLTSRVTFSVAGYGLASVSASAYVLPIVLAACTLGLGAGLGLAGVSACIAWVLAGGETAGWHQPLLQPHAYHLTFSAPALTLLYVLMALVSGIWTRYLVRCLRSE